MAEINQLASLVARLEAVTNKLEKKAGGGGDANSGDVAQQVSDYDVFIKTSFGPLKDATNAVNLPKASEGVELLLKLAGEQRKLIEFSTKHSKPTDQDMADILGPMVKIADEIVKLREFVLHPKNKCSRYEGFFLDAMYEAITAFSWIQTPLPVPHVQALIEAVFFHTNKILKEKKDNGKEWEKSFKQMLQNLKAFVKENYATGFMWSGNKPKATGAGYLSAGSAAPSSGAPPPPPPPAGPPPPPAGPPPSSYSAPVAGGEDTRTQLLASLNKGASVTTGLKKVTDDMKTHKNPNLRMGSAVPYKKPAAASSVKPVIAKKQAAKKPPKLALEGKTWNVEYQENQQNLVIDEAQMKQTVYIFKCNNATVHVKNKVNSITLDLCKKVAVVFESVVSGVEFINCQSVQAQVHHQLPTANIEKTDGCIIYLSKECLDCQIITAKSSEMNVCVPNDQGEFDEFPIMEQFKTTYNPVTKKVVTECYDSVA